MKHSPIESAHMRMGAKMVPFAGWNMPVQYTSIIDEHNAVRTRAGVFDISHMGQFFVSGPQAGPWLNRLLTNDVNKLAPGQGQYTIMLNDRGGVIDDLIAYRTGDHEFFLVVNASMIDEDHAWMTSHAVVGATLRDESPQWAGMAVQGPLAREVFSKALPGQTLPERNGISITACGAILCRTGYTGEDGFEFFCPAADGVSWWDKFLANGAAACGLGARDTLRLEMGYPLNGNDLSPHRTPVEAGLGFFCDLEKGDFIGREILARQKASGTDHKLAALQYTDKGPPPRAHYPVVSAEGTVIGELSSGALSPSLMSGIGMAYLPVSFSKPGTMLQIDVRGRRFPATVVKKPFYKSPQS
jgi:aminomethyltransferase